MSSEIKICPMCKKEVLWDNMIWLEGQCTCPQCYQHKRMLLDREIKAQRRDDDEG